MNGLNKKLPSFLQNISNRWVILKSMFNKLIYLLAMYGEHYINTVFEILYL